MRSVFCLCLGALLSTAPLSAAASGSDRLREIVYRPDAVYPVQGAFRRATEILFGPDEVIRHAAIGDSVGWEVAVDGSVLFLKPREAHGPTNLMVVTGRGTETRHYAFALSTVAAGSRAAVWRIRFTYPDDDRARAAAALDAAAAAARERLVTLELDRAAVEGPRNLAWSAQGDRALQPLEVSDNSRFTVLRFAGSQALPAVFEVGEDGSERLVPYDVRGDHVVIHAVVRGLRLRRGRSVLCLYNEAFSVAAPAGAGAASPAVERTPAGGDA